MSIFDDILSDSEEGLLQRFYKFKAKPNSPASSITEIAKSLILRKEQLICALGFNPDARLLIEILPTFGYATFNELDHERNEIFVSDIYKKIPLDNVEKIHERIKSNQQMLEVMQYLLKSRLEKVESEIETTVNSMIIEKYKSEMRAVYSLGIASIEFTEARLDKRDSGFRALLNEVTMIVENKLMPVGEIFFRDTILPQEKQKLLNKGLIPKELVQLRINESDINPEEKKVLNDYLRTNKE